MTEHAWHVYKLVCTVGLLLSSYMLYQIIVTVIPKIISLGNMTVEFELRMWNEITTSQGQTKKIYVNKIFVQRKMSDVTTFVSEKTTCIWSIYVQIIFSVTRSCLHESRTKNDRSYDLLHLATYFCWLAKTIIRGKHWLAKGTHTQTYKGRSDISSVQI